MVNNLKVTNKGFTNKAFKLTQSEVRQVKMYLNYQQALLASLGCPDSAIKSYVRTMRVRLTNETTGFLSELRGLFIQGVKILGGDTPVFSDKFRQKNGYPRLYRFVFTELKKLHDTWYAGSAKSNVSRARGLLSVLYSARGLHLRHSDRALNKAFLSFKERVQPKGEPTNYAELSDSTVRMLESRFQSVEFDNKFPYGSYFDPSKRTQKPSLNKEEFRVPQIISRVARVDGSLTGTMSRSFPSFIVKGPIGKVTVLSEKGGKTRVICGYNGFVNATDLYDRARYYLDLCEQDASKRQSLGHFHAQRLSAWSRFSTSHSIQMKCDIRQTSPESASRIQHNWLDSLKKLFGRNTIPTSDSVKPRSGLISLGNKILSADLTAFTDTIEKFAYLGCLRFLKAANLAPVLFTSEVVYPQTGETLKPSRALMGLKGCFDVASMIHHSCLDPAMNYRICGDDFVGVVTPEIYESCVSSVGMSLNGKKTLYSSDTALFCGKVYKDGYDISPYAPSFRSIADSDLDAIRTSVQNGYLFRCQFRQLVSMCKANLPPKRYFSFELPTKLGGIDSRSRSRSILEVLSVRRNFVIASNSVPKERLRSERRSRNTLPGVPFSGTRVLPWTQLYTHGGIQLPKSIKPSHKMWGKLLGLSDILEYYYFSTPVKTV